MTAAEMYQKSVKLVTQLSELGIRQGDLVTVCVANFPNSTPMMVALLALGTVVNCLDQNNLTKYRENKKIPTQIDFDLIISAFIF